MNLAELRFRTVELAGHEFDQGLPLNPGDADRYLNSAYQAALNHRAWPFLLERIELPTEPGIQDYEAAAVQGDVQSILGVRELEEPYKRLRPRPSGELGAEASGRPSEYAVLDRRAVRLWPTPDDVFLLSVDVSVFPPRLTADADVPVFPERFHDLLCYAAAAQAVRRRREDGDAGRAKDLDDHAGLLLHQMEREELADRDLSPSVMSGRHVRHTYPALGFGRRR